MTKTAIALRHLGFEDLGTIEPILCEQGYTVHYLDVGIDEISQHEGLAADLLVVLGGPIGANDGHLYPVVNQTIELLRQRLADRRPTLGICLGAQLMARALNASVAPGKGPEIGYELLTLTEEGERSVLRHLAATPVLHWHNDTFTIPLGATRLAASSMCDNQSFSVGENLLALQFHLEVPQRDVEHWLIGHAEALANANIDPRRLRGQAVDHGGAMEQAASLVIAEWLAGLQ